MQTNPPDPESAAAGLTKAQRDAVLRKVTHWSGRQTATALRPCWTDVGRPLMDRGLIAFWPNPRRSDTRLTPFGEQVRAALQSKETK